MIEIIVAKKDVNKRLLKQVRLCFSLLQLPIASVSANDKALWLVRNTVCYGLINTISGNEPVVRPSLLLTSLRMHTRVHKINRTYMYSAHNFANTAHAQS